MRLLLAAVAAVAALATPALAAAPIEGLWATPEDGGQVEITRCGDAFCGRIVTSNRIKADPNLKDSHNKDPALRDRSLKGLRILEDFRGGPEEWKGGTAYRPEDGGTYRGVLKLTGPNTLKVTGCIVFPLCKSETWTRIR